MKPKPKLFRALLCCAVALGIGSALSLVAQCGPEGSTGTTSAKTSAAVPWAQIVANASADYRGAGLAVSPTGEGARLRCAFQRLVGEAVPDGLWLTSTVTNAVNDHFRVVAASVGRRADVVQTSSPGSLGHPQADEAQRDENTLDIFEQVLPRTGTVFVDGQRARFTRPGLVEEYSVSMEGVRQDFVVLERSAGAGDLAVRLAVSGAKLQAAAFGVQLVLENSGRRIAYSRLRVTDATGKELSARMEVMGSGAPAAQVEAPLTDGVLALLVNDLEAVYPVRIDPTFSDANWISMGGLSGANQAVRAAEVDASGNLYIGGYFTIVGNVIANYVAKWDGSSWSALGSGMDDWVFALAVSGSDVYAGGRFTTAGGVAASCIAKWNGSTWTALGPGVGGALPGLTSRWVSALAVSGSDVYVGGNFTTAGGSAATNVAKWNGSSWSALGSGMGGGVSGYGIPSTVFALVVSGTNVYAGGNFTTAGGNVANNVAKWNGSSWMGLGSGTDESVTALTASGNNVYAGGPFTTAGGSAAFYVAKWNGSSWSALGSGIGGRPDPFGNFPPVSALAISGGELYVGGWFTMAGGGAANSVAKWNGSSWAALGSGTVAPSSSGPAVQALAVSGSSVYAGGYFTTAGSSPANYIAKWNGTSWSALGSGIGSGFFSFDASAEVNAVAMSGSNLFAAGAFTTAGSSPATNIARWDGSSWAALGSGVDDVVNALAVSGSDVYVGGSFTTAGRSPASYIARWDGSSWAALGSGMNNQVSALAVLGSDLYAGGPFTTAGGSAANRIAKWDGSGWSALGAGMNGDVWALAVSGSDVYAAGSFTMAGGSAATNIAKWDGTAWSALGSGISGPPGDPVYHYGGIVYALAVSGSEVYAGGAFTTAGGGPATNISKWDGSSWSALGSGIGGPYAPFVYALTVSGSNVYAGGGFTAAGGNPANFIAKWDGSSWSALGSGMGGFVGEQSPLVSALAVSGTDLYAGGTFVTAGGKVSAYIARAYLLTLPALSVLRSGAAVKVSWPSTDSAGFSLEQAGALAAMASWAPNPASVTDDGTNKSVSLPATSNSQFFRLRRP